MGKQTIKNINNIKPGGKAKPWKAAKLEEKLKNKNKNKKHQNKQQNVPKPIIPQVNSAQLNTSGISSTLTSSLTSNKNLTPLQMKFLKKLEGARFRSINEELYTNTGENALSNYTNDPVKFHSYHQGYREQVNKWPINPLDVIISWLNNMNKAYTIADMGCGEGKLARCVMNPEELKKKYNVDGVILEPVVENDKKKDKNNKINKSCIPRGHIVNSFDLYACMPHITACDISKTNLESNSVDIVIFCLSLMGTNATEYLKEAHRILKRGGIIRIVEVRSRVMGIEDEEEENKDNDDNEESEDEQEIEKKNRLKKFKNKSEDGIQKFQSFLRKAGFEIFKSLKEGQEYDNGNIKSGVQLSRDSLDNPITTNKMFYDVICRKVGNWNDSNKFQFKACQYKKR